MTDLISRINQIRDASGQPVVNPILAAAIQANTNLAVEGQNQRAADQQAEADQKMSFMMKGDRASVKNMPVTDFIAAAAESGSRKVAEMTQLLRPASESARIHQMVQSYGINTPDPNDPELLNGITGYRESYRAARETGHNPIVSAILGLANKAGITNPQRSAETLQSQRSTNDLVIADRLILPQEQLAERDRTQTRLEQQAADAERRKRESIVRELINKTDLREYPDEESMYADIAKQAGMDALGPALMARARQKRVQDTEKFAVNRFDALRAQKKGYLSLDELATVATDLMGRKPTDAEFSILRADQQGEIQSAANAQRQQERADERLARYLNGKPEKPHAINSFEASNASVDSLISARGDEAIDQPSLMRATDARIGKLEKQYQDLYAQSVANTAAYNQLNRIQEELKKKKAQDPSIETKLVNYRSIGAGIVQRAKQIEADLVKLRGGAAAMGTNVLTKDQALAKLGK